MRGEEDLEGLGGGEEYVQKIVTFSNNKKIYNLKSALGKSKSDTENSPSLQDAFQERFLPRFSSLVAETLRGAKSRISCSQCTPILPVPLPASCLGVPLIPRVARTTTRDLLAGRCDQAEELPVT